MVDPVCAVTGLYGALGAVRRRGEQQCPAKLLMTNCVTYCEGQSPDDAAGAQRPPRPSPQI